jgi:hypothetical protein
MTSKITKTYHRDLTTVAEVIYDDYFHKENISHHRREVHGFEVDGIFLYKMFYMDGLLHREDGPANIFYNYDGSIYSYEYHNNGKLHRKDGPACSYADTDGNIYREEYYIDGKELTKSEWFLTLSIKERVGLLLQTR